LPHTIYLIKMPSVKIPSSLFDTFQAVFKVEAKRICKNAALMLNRPEKEVLNKIVGSQLTIQILDDHDMPISCPVIMRHRTILERCRRPCLLGTGRCLTHQAVAVQDSLPSNIQKLTRIESSDQYEPLWCDESTGTVYNSSGSIVGFYKDEQLELYILETNEMKQGTI